MTVQYIYSNKKIYVIPNSYTQTYHFGNINIVFTRIIMRIKLLEKHRKITLVFPIQIKVNNISIKKPGMKMTTFGKKEMLWLYYIKN